MQKPTNVTPVIDERDRQILRLVQRDASLAQAEIARRVGLSTAAVHERLKKLESVGRHPPLDRGGGRPAGWRRHHRLRGGVPRSPAPRTRAHRARGEAGRGAGVPPRDRRVLAAVEGARGGHGGAAAAAAPPARRARRREPDAHGGRPVDRQGRDVRRPSSDTEEPTRDPDHHRQAHDDRRPGACRAGAPHPGRRLRHGARRRSEPGAPSLGRAPRPVGPRHVLVLRHRRCRPEPPEDGRPGVPREAAAGGARQPDELGHLHARVRRVRGDVRPGRHPVLPARTRSSWPAARWASRTR